MRPQTCAFCGCFIAWGARVKCKRCGVEVVRPSLRGENQMSELLQSYLADGTVWVENSTYFGKDSRGQAVQIGNSGEDVDRYLVDYPEPSDW